jgi:outer membrane receptor protein involved in Fe transport
MSWHNQWQVQKDTQVRLSVNNLLDEAYAARADYTGFTGYRYFPGEPRAFVVGFTHRF